MIKRIILGFLFMCTLASAATGVEIALQITGLEGDCVPQFRPYGALPCQKSAIFEALTWPPFTVNSASFRIVGTATINELLCGASQWYPGYFHFSVEFPDSITGGSWIGDYINLGQSGPFDITVPMTTETGASWEYFEEIRILDIYLSGTGCCYSMDQFGPCSEALVSETYLVLDVEFSVSTHESTWGIIKALYRSGG